MKNLLTLIALVICIGTYAQQKKKIDYYPFGGFGGTTSGGLIQMGSMIGNWEYELSYQRVLNGTTMPKVLGLSAGYSVWVTDNVTNNLLVTPAAGIGYYRRIDMSRYDADDRGRTGFDTTKVLRPFYKVEFGWQREIIRPYITFSYCVEMYIGIGIKFVKP